ncbi:MAG: hypothetical protein ABL997_09270 [Planctomycetota bacterium]
MSALNARVLALVWSVVVSDAAQAQLPIALRTELRPLERAAEELAKAGRGDACAEVIGLMAQLGFPSKETPALQKRLHGLLAKATSPTRGIDKASEAVHAAAMALVPAIARQTEDAARRRAAELVLALDDSVDAAHLALGHEKSELGYGPPGSAKRVARSRLVQRAIEDSRRLPVEVSIEVLGKDPATATPDKLGELASDVVGEPLLRAQFANVVIYSSLPSEQLRRIATDAARIYAFLTWCRTGQVSTDGMHALQIAVVGEKARYRRAVALALERGWFDERRAADLARLSSGSFEGRKHFGYAMSEQQAVAMLVYLMHEWLVSPATLEAGLVSYGCRAVAGLPGPAVATSVEHMGKANGTVSTLAGELQLRERMMRLANAGLLGSRSWLRYLTERGEDPDWQKTMLPQFGDLQGDILLKASSVAEFLVVEDRLGALNQIEKKEPGTDAEKLERALGVTLADFERMWSEWLLGSHSSLRARLLQSEPDTLAKSEKAALGQLDQIRARAFAAKSGFVSPQSQSPLEVDRDASRGCALHSAYLAVHPERAAAWPDAHIQLSEHADWTADGCWAGSRSVIAPGVASLSDAVEAWMGTFFHRLPLLDPGLVRVGLGHEKGIAVLDCGSFVQPPTNNFFVAWPYDGQQKVPTRFVPELPNPVPGEDQAGFGYPITLQTGLENPEAEVAPVVRMKLLLGSESGAEVDCWFTSPQQPLNPALAPDGSYCLIPKRPLQPGSTYFVVADWIDGSRRVVWKFST